MYKSLYDISWQVPESEYRADPALSYSTISHYEKGGRYDSLLHLFDKIKTPSLTFGQVVDCITTDGEEEFWNTFYVDDVPDLDPKVANTVKFLFDNYSDTCDSIDKISDVAIVAAVKSFGIFNNCSKTDTIVRKMQEAGGAYYRAMYLADGKIIISNEVHNRARAAVEALRASPATAPFFMPNPFDNDIEILYQTKFKSTINNVDYRVMFDVLYVDHKRKFIIPGDLKTTSSKEYAFAARFVEYRYDLQAKLYSKVLIDNLLQDEYFKDFEVKPWILFVVNNQGNPNPLAWQFDLNLTPDGWYYGKDNKYLRGPLEIGEELKYYLDNECVVPKGIHIDKPNNLIEWLNKL